MSLDGVPFPAIELWSQSPSMSRIGNRARTLLARHLATIFKAATQRPRYNAAKFSGQRDPDRLKLGC